MAVTQRGLGSLGSAEVEVKMEKDMENAALVEIHSAEGGMDSKLDRKSVV